MNANTKLGILARTKNVSFQLTALLFLFAFSANAFADCAKVYRNQESAAWSRKRWLYALQTGLFASVIGYPVGRALEPKRQNIERKLEGQYQYLIQILDGDPNGDGALKFVADQVDKCPHEVRAILKNLDRAGKLCINKVPKRAELVDLIRNGNYTTTHSFEEDNYDSYSSDDDYDYANDPGSRYSNPYRYHPSHEFRDFDYR